MKGSPREHSPTCSCTSCKSTRAPLKRSDGESIETLNCGKNMPLKERILLTKLTRARAEYDALIKELLSRSSGSEKADLKGRKHVKHPDGNDSSSILLDIVDLVDRDATLNSLSECCSCCACSSTDVKKERHKHKHGHHRHTETICEGGGDVEPKKKGKSEVESKTESEPPIKIREPKKLVELKPKPKEKAVLKKAFDTTTSKIKSASSTCSLKFSGLIKESKVAVKKLRKEKEPKKKIEANVGFWTDEYNAGKIIRRPNELSRGSYEKRIEETKLRVKKHLQTEAGKSLEKEKESKTTIKSKTKKSLEKIKILESTAKIKDKARRSIEKIKESKTNLKAKIKKSLEQLKPKIKASPKLTKLKHEEEVIPRSRRSITPSSKTESEFVFPVDKETLGEFREERKNIKDWVCGPECIPKKCSSRKCLEILIPKQGNKTKQTRIKSNTKIHKKTITNSSASIQAGGISTTTVGSKTKVIPQKKNKKEGNKKSQINLDMKGNKGLERKIFNKTKSATSSISVKSVMNGMTWHDGKRKKESSPERKLSVKSVTDASAASSQSIKPDKNQVIQYKEKEGSPARIRSVTSITDVSQTTIHKPKVVAKEKELRDASNAPKWEIFIESLTAVTSNISSRCATLERKKSIKSTTVISQPSTKLSQRNVRPYLLNSITSQGVTAVSQPRKPILQKRMRPDPIISATSNERPAVRISSTFSFDIEFYKNKPDAQHEQTEPKKEIKYKSTGKKKPIKHRYSQKTITTSRQSTAINSIRRCYCTLKLGKPNKIKRPKAKHVSKRSKISKRSIKIIPSQREIHVSRTIATEKRENNRYRQRKLLPYEYEPGVCVPNSCDTYEWIKLINKRERPHLKYRPRQSVASNHKTRSTLSFTSRKVHHKTKRGQSTVFANKTEVPARKYNQTVTTITERPRVARTSPSSMSRQAVRIGSSFNFSIELYKNRPSVASDVPIKQGHRREKHRKEVRERDYRPESPRPPKKKHLKKVKSKASESSSHVNAKHQQKSIIMKSQRTGNISSAIMRCFCILKLKKAKPKKKASQATTKDELKVATVGTKTKRKKYKLKPYECEPYVCIPGECDPCECLERIKKRMHSGTSPERLRTRFVSNTFYSSASSASIGTYRPRVKEQDTTTKRKKIKNVTESLSPSLVLRPTGTTPKQIHLIKRPVAAPARQAVRIGSTFSFDIEFYKNRPSVEERDLVYPSSDIQIHESIRKIKERKKKQKARQTDSNRRNMKSPTEVVSRSDQESQASTPKKRDRNIGVKSLLKRCFCSLQLQKELRKKQKPTAKIYTVNRVTVGETRITAQRQLMSYQYKHSTHGHECELYKSREITIGNKRYLHPDSSACTKPSSSESNIALKQKQSTQHCHEGELSNERSFQLIPWDSFSTSETLEETKLDSFTSFCTFSRSNTGHQSGKKNQTPKFMESSEQKTSFSLSRLLVSSLSPLLRRWFCILNPDMSNKNNKADKLSPDESRKYENKYDLDQSKLIMKCSMKQSSSVSTTTSQSTASRSQSLRANKKAKNFLSRPNRTTDLQTESLSSYPQVIKSVSINSEKPAVYAVSNFGFDSEYQKTFSQDQFQKTKQFLSRLPCPPQMMQPVLNSTSIKYVNQTTNKRTARRNVQTDHSNSKSTEKFESKSTHITPKFVKSPWSIKLQNKRRKKDSSTQNTTTHSKNIKHEIKPQTSGVRPNIKPPRSIQVYRLDPNECNLGISTSDSCGPYKYLKFISLRNRRYQNTGLGSATVDAKSVSSHSRKRHRKRQDQHHVSTSRKHRAIVIREKHTRSVSPTKITSSHRQFIKHESGSRQTAFFKHSSRHSASTVIKEVRPAPKVPRNKSKAYAPKKRSNSIISHETKSTTRNVGCRKALHNRKSQIHTNKHNNKIGPTMLKRCFSTLKLQKKGRQPVHATPHKIKKPANNQYTKTVPYKPTATAHSKSVMSKEKTRERPKLLPKCELVVRKPGSYNSIKCLERIKTRNFKEMGTDARRPRSSSTKNSDTTCTRARQIRRHHKHPKAAHFTATTKAPKQKKVYRERLIKVPSHKIIESSQSSSSKKSVRFGSIINLDGEFFKVQNVYHPLPQKKVTREVKTRLSRIKPPKTRRVKSHRQKNIRSMQSQAIAKHVRNKMTEVKPFLKRCFCTLKLPNRKKDETGKSTKKKPVKPIVKNVGSAVSKTSHKEIKQNKKEQPHKTNIHKHENKAVALKSTTSTLKVIMPPKAGICTMTNKNTKKHKVRKLEPYECESGVCTPGNYNPYECLKRIKNRGMKNTLSGTHHHQECTTSSQTTRTTKQRGGQTTRRHHKCHHRQSQMTTKIPQPLVTPEKHLVEPSRFKSTSISLRQAVYIRSSLELYNKTPTCQSVKLAKPTPVRIIKKEHHEPKRKKSQASHVHEKRIRHQGPYAPCAKKTDNKDPGIPPLHKQKATKSTSKNVESKTVATKTRKERKPKVREHKAKSDTVTLGVAMKKKLYVLKPYECEPFVCVPGQCDPYECDKRIRRRIMKDCGTGDRPCKKQSSATYTPQDGTFRCIETQCDITRKHGTKTTTTIAPKSHPVPRYCKLPKQNVIHIPNKSQRQSINVGSTFGCGQIHGARVATVHKGTGMDPLKRKLQKAPAPPPYMIKFEVLPNAATQTKPMRDKKEKCRKLTPYECEPGYCIPGECDPLKCLERMRRKFYKEHGTVSHACNQSTKCIAAKRIPTCRHHNTQCDLKHGKKYTQKTEYIPTHRLKQMPRQEIVEIPHFPNFGEDVKIGSNISCSIEFYKETLSPSFGTRCKPQKIHIGQEPIKYNKPPKQPKIVQECLRLKHTKTECSKGRLKDINMQSECMKKAHKGISAGKVLKRCFCTLKLQDTSAYKKMYTVGRVAVLEDRKNPRLVCKETKNEINNAIESKLNTHENFIFPPRLDCDCYDCIKFNENELICNITHTAHKTDSVKTIFPYYPHKFNNNISYTLINNKKTRFPDKINCSHLNYDRNKKHDIPFALTNSRKKEKKNKKSKKYKQPIKKEESEKTLSSKLKGFIRRCMGLFKKSTNEKIVPNKVQKLSELKPTERRKKNKRSKQEKKSDSNVLKTSKSDRHPTNAKMVCVPKQSKSVKVTKVSESDKSNSQFQEKGEKKYSRFQSGDTAQIQMKKNIQNKINIPQDQKKLVKNRLGNTIQIGHSSTELSKNNVMSYYRRMHYNDQINNFMKYPPFMDHKVVQMATMMSCVGKNVDPNLCISTMAGSSNGTPPKVCKDQDQIQDFDYYQPPKHVSKNPNCNDMMNLQGKCCSCEKSTRIPSVKPDIENITRTKPEPKPKAKHCDAQPRPVDKMEKCKTLQRCPYSKGGRRKLSSTFLKKEDPKKKHVGFTLSINKHGKCVVEYKTASPKDVTKVQKTLNKATEERKKKHCCDRTPLLEMKLGSQDLQILNRNKVYDEIKKLESKRFGRRTGAHYKNVDCYGDLTTEQIIQLHGKSCICCICVNRRREDTRKSQQLIKGQKPCVCGSKPCASLSFKLATEAMARCKAERERRICPCGMDICFKETLKQDLKKRLISKEKAEKLMEHESTKRELRKQEAIRKEYLMRQKRYKIEDDQRRARQRQEEIYWEQQVKKYKNTSNALLVAESALDFTKLVVSTVPRTIRFLCRSIIHYKGTIKSLKTAKQDPARILTNIKGVYDDSAIKSTFRRIKMRQKATRCRVRRRETKCNLFLATLRRKPKAVFYICPWFYPHFTSIIRMLKQSAYVMLFILAVVVWSPCILAMEMCRMLVCCTLCNR